MIQLADAELSSAFEVHRLNGLMAFAILLQIPYRIFCLRTGRIAFGTRVPRLFGSFLIEALLINWVIGVSTGSERDAIRQPPNERSRVRGLPLPHRHGCLSAPLASVDLIT